MKYKSFCLLTAVCCFIVIKGDLLGGRNISLRENKNMYQIKSEFCSDEVLKEKIKLSKKYSTLDDYNKGKKGNDEIINLLEGEAVNIVKLVTNFIAWVIFIVFSGIILITYFFLLCCLCCNCCVFNNTRKADSSCKWILSIIFLLFNGVVFLSTICGLSFMGQIKPSINDSICSLSSFFTDFIAGSDDGSWIGTSNVITSLNDILQPITDFDINHQNSDNNFGTDYKTSCRNIETNLENIEDRAPLYDTTMPPDYKTSVNEYITQLRTEYEEGPKALTDFLTDITDLFSDALDNSDITESINTIINSLNDLSDTVEEMYDSVGVGVIAVRDIAVKYIVFIFKIIFSFFFVASCAILGSFGLIMVTKWKWLRVIIHIAWNFEILIGFVTLIIGSAFGILGQIGGIIGPTVTYLLGPIYLASPSNVFGASGDITKYVSTCLNGNGEIFKDLDIADSLKFSELDEEMGKVSEEANKFGDHKSVVGQNFNDYVTNLQGTNFDEIKCNDGTSISDMYGILGVTDRTAALGATCSDYSDRNKEYCQFIQKCDDDLTDLLASIGTYNSNFETNADQISQDWNTSTGELQKLATEIGEIGQNITTLISKMNCNFLSTDIIFFISKFCDNFGETSSSVAYCCVFASLGSFIGVFFIGAMYYWEKDVSSNIAPSSNYVAPKDDFVEPYMRNNPANQLPNESNRGGGSSTEFLNLNNNLNIIKSPDINSNNNNDINNINIGNNINNDNNFNNFNNNNYNNDINDQMYVDVNNQMNLNANKLEQGYVSAPGIN